MGATALALVLASGVVHALWNLAAKRVSSGLPFVWLCETVGVVTLAPVIAALAFAGQLRLTPAAAAFGVASGAMHGTYSLMLQRAYRTGDLSLVYPIARGLAPLLSVTGAIVLLGERPGSLAIGGALLVSGGVLVLVSRPGLLHAPGARAGALWGGATAISVAVYTVWDGYAVRDLDAGPLTYVWLANLSALCLLGRWAIPRRREVAAIWERHRLAVFGVALGQIASYALVLAAFAIASVSYVAPAREVGILVGVALGARLLREEDPRRRLVGATAIVLGIIALAVG